MANLYEAVVSRVHKYVQCRVVTGQGHQRTPMAFKGGF